MAVFRNSDNSSKREKSRLGIKRQHRQIRTKYQTGH